MTDQDSMPWGKHQGTKMEDVPASYLLWLWNNKKCSGDMKDYISRNMAALEKEAPDIIVTEREGW